MSKKKRRAAVSRPAPAAAAAVPKPVFPPLLWAILAMAAVIRFLYLKSSETSPFYEPLLLDPKYYHDWAVRLTHGQWDTGVFYGLPLYPYFLAVCYKISGVSVGFVKLVQALLGVVTVFLVFKAGEKLRDARTGLAAAFFAAIYGPLFFHEQIFIPETLGVPLYALSFLLVLRFLDERTVRNAIFLGIAAGLATLTKAGILLFMIGLFIVLAVRSLGKKGVLLPLAACALFYFGTLFPVTLHNWVRGKDSVLLTSHAGFNFYIGNNPDAEGVYKAPEGTGSNVDAQILDSRAVAEQAMGRELKPSEVSKYWSDKAWAFIRQNPGRFFALCGRKLVLFFDGREISDVDDYKFCSQLVDFLKIPWMNFAFLVPFLFAGFVSLFRNPKYRGVTFGWIAAYLIGLATFFVNARYRLPLLPVFFVLSAMGALDLYEGVQKAQWAAVASLVLAAAAGIFISRAELVKQDITRDYINAGDALMEKKDVEDAKSFYAQALNLNPSSAKANLAMGLAYSHEGDYGQAKDYYEKSIQADPTSSQAFNNLGLWYDREHDFATAEKYFLKAIELKPDSAQAHNNLGMLYGKAGDNDRAMKEFDLSLKYNPGSPRARTNLGLIYHRMGRKDEAVRLWKEALVLDPEFPEAKKALELMGGESAS